MPPKKQQTAKQNHPNKENEPLTTAAASFAQPFHGLSDNAAEQQEELDSLEAIYGFSGDFEKVEGETAAWSVSSLDRSTLNLHLTHV